MSIVKAYNSIGQGLDMSTLRDGFGIFTTDITSIILISDDPFDLDTNIAVFDVIDGGNLNIISLLYQKTISGHLVIESVFFLDNNINPLTDWFAVEMLISYEDFIASDGLWMLDGFNGADEIIGNKYADIIKGGDLNDKLRGKAGDDKLLGERGNDILDGGNGADQLKGGRGADDFVFRKISDIGLGSERDRIADFSRGSDLIALKAIDADTTIAGDQEFDFIGKGRFGDEAGELRCRGGIISGDVDGDGRADFQIELANGLTVRGIDFLL